MSAACLCWRLVRTYVTLVESFLHVGRGCALLGAMAVVAREAAHGRRLAGLLQLDAWVWGCQPGSGVDLLGLWCVVNTAGFDN